jgi:hypothetical protein
MWYSLLTNTSIEPEISQRTKILMGCGIKINKSAEALQRNDYYLKHMNLNSFSPSKRIAMRHHDKDEHAESTKKIRTTNKTNAKSLGIYQ